MSSMPSAAPRPPLVHALLTAVVLAACGGGGGGASVGEGGAGTGSGGDGATAQGAVVTRGFMPTDADIPNPERGFYGWSGNDFLGSFDAGSAQVAYQAGQRLVLAKVQLDPYRSSDLPDSVLVTLDGRFAQLRSLGLKATLLFNYDFSAGGNDASAEQIRRHLEQLKPVLAANADVIPFMRAGFIGAWGEWHSSRSGNSCGDDSPGTPCTVADANRTIVRDALLANVPATTQIAFRVPADLVKWYPAATQQSRAGMHNDCFLSGPSDTGTYRSVAQRSYVQMLSDRAAFGAETCTGEQPARNNCSDILGEGAAYHLAWMNARLAPGLAETWEAQGCLGEVSRRMGYRLQLDAVSHDTRVARGGTAVVHVDLRNVGWARVFSARPLVLALRHRPTGAILRAAGGDLRDLEPQASSSTRLSLPLAVPPDAAVGDYEILLGAPDVFAATAADPRFALRFANADDPAAGQAWDVSQALFGTGRSLQVF
jgi:hypothetical protein